MTLDAFPWRRRLLLAAALASLAGAPAWANTATAWPAKPVKVIVNFPPGGAADQIARAVAQPLQEALKQPVVVENRGGANGNLGGEAVARAPADGYTLLMAVNSTMAINPAIYPKLQYDPIKDFSPVAMVYTSANVLMVNAKSPYRSVADLVSYAKANPGKLNYGSSGNGATPHLSGEMFRRMAGISINHVPYKGIGPAIVDLIGGQIELVFSDTSAMTQVTGGNLRALAVTGPSRLGMAPNLPTMQEQGFPGFSIRSWYSIAAPAGTPKAVVERLNAEIAKVVRSPEMRQRMKDIGVDPAEDTSVHYLDATTRADLAMWKKFVTEADIKLD